MTDGRQQRRLIFYNLTILWATAHTRPSLLHRVYISMAPPHSQAQQLTAANHNVLDAT